MSSGRVTQSPLEVLAEPSTQKARVTQSPLEVLAEPSTQKARVTQAVLEVLAKFEPPDTDILITDVVNNLHLDAEGGAFLSRSSLIPYVSLDGIQTYLKYIDDMNFDIIGDEAYVANPGLTLGGWFWFDDIAGTLEAMMAKWEETGNDRAYRLIRDAAGTISFWVSDDGTAIDSQASTATPAAGTWTYCVGRFVPSTSVDIYVGVTGDPVPEKSTNGAGIPATLNDSAEAFLIGAEMATPADFMDGRASLCFLVASALPDLIINSLFQQTKALFGV